MRQVFGIETKRLDDEIGTDRKSVARIGFGNAATAGVRRTEPHFRHADIADRAIIARSERFGRGEPDEFDAFFLGIGDFALRPRHVGAVAAIEAFD